MPFPLPCGASINSINHLRRRVTELVGNLARGNSSLNRIGRVGVAKAVGAHSTLGAVAANPGWKSAATGVVVDQSPAFLVAGPAKAADDGRAHVAQRGPP